MDAISDKPAAAEPAAQSPPAPSSVPIPVTSVAEAAKPARKPLRRARKIDLIISVVLLAVFLWQIGFLTYAVEFITNAASPQGPQKIRENFMVVVPTGDPTITASTGEVLITLNNSVEDKVTVRNVTLRNIGAGMDCQLKTRLPFIMEPGRLTNITAVNCAPKDAKPQRMARIGVVVSGKAPLKSKLLSDKRMTTPLISYNLTDEQKEKTQDQIRKNILALKNAAAVVDFSSSGTLIGVYS
jgi:hypothetical protein